MYTGLCIGAILGLSMGLILLSWLFVGDHLNLNIPKPTSVDDDFSTLSKFWVNFSIGDAQIEYLNEVGCAGDKFVRLKVKHSDSDQLTLAQLDDYSYRPRADFNWEPPLKFEIRMRFSEQNGPGSAGFYLWNNPLPLGGELSNIRYLKWMGFYRVSPDANLSFFEEKGNFRATIFNGRWRDALAFINVPFAPKLRLKELNLDERGDWTQWHTYQVEWYPEKVNMGIDDETILTYETKLKGPLSLVIWYDNNCPQIAYKKFDLKMSAIDAPAWLDVDFVKIHPLT